MADAIPFKILDDDNAPVSGAEGTFTRAAWNGQTGAPRTPAPIVAVPGVAGGYELRTTDADAAAAAVTLVDFGEGRNPRRLLFWVCKPDKTNQVVPVIFTDEDGELWVGGGGTVSGWTGPTPPTVFKLADGVFVVRPTLDDIAADASGFIVPEPGASPEEGYAIGVEPLGESPDTPLPPQPPAPVIPGQDSGSLAAGDIRLHVDRFGRANVALVANDLETDPGLETAMLLSLFLNRRDDTVEDPTQAGGWWADGLLVPGDRIGSRLWRISPKRAPDTVALLQAYALEALQWLVEDRVAVNVGVTAELTADGYELNISIVRPNRNDPSRFRFGRTWLAQENR